MSVLVIVGVEQALREILLRQIALEEKMDQLLLKEAQIMASIDDVLAGVTEEGTVATSLVALAGNLHQLYLDALSGVTLPPAVQAKLDQIQTLVAANKAMMEEAVVSNTPHSPA